MSRDAERDYLESVEDGSAIIDPKSLSDAIKAIQGTVRARGASRNATQYVTLATTGDVAKLEHWSVDYPIRTIEGTYPQTQTLWPTQKTLDESTTSTIVLDPRFMAKFAKVAPWCNDKTSAMRVELNDEVRPAVLTSVDKSTRCMIMPVRIK
jgi:DNA polymerase III sliding clamp (beta) subunit (PCNA family)